jgi:hypothetical protein
MSTTARLVAAAIAIAVVAVGGAALFLRPGGISNVGAPSPRPASSLRGLAPAPSHSPAAPTATVAPSQSPAPSAAIVPVGSLNKSHVSSLYAYKVRYPATWNLTVGKVPGLPDNVPADLSLMETDFYGDPASGHGLMVTSGPLSATRKDLASFSSLVERQVASKFGVYLDIGACDQPTRTLLLDGEPANEIDFICPNHNWLWVTAVHAGRAYQIAWLDDGGFGSSSLRPLLDKFLKTFAFTG